jgi:Outer membrane efflux protein
MSFGISRSTIYTGRRSASLLTAISTVVTVASLCCALLSVGCTTPSSSWRTTVGNDTTEVDSITRQVDNPAPPVFTDVRPSERPVTVRTVSESEVTHIDWSLEQTLQYGLEHSTVLRDIGGTILRSPETVTTTLSTQRQETDPRFGQEAALSAFDAQLAASATFNNNDRLYNNAFFAGGTNAFRQDYSDYNVELSKRTATGSLLAVRGVHNYDSNNAPANTFTSSWNSWIEGEMRQPLLQGGGLEFNRIAGPGSTPGVYNGVLIAKVNLDINQADFTVSLRDYVSNVENAYWDLYLSYRELDARKKAMERALAIWNEYKGKAEGELISVAEEALARNQYYQFKAEVDETLSGKVLAGTQVRNGSMGGTLQVGTGVLAAERRLRLLIGLPASDGSLVRPSDEPTMADIHFDWDSGMQEALTQRPELQRQNVTVKKREMELLAARNFLNPRLDAFGRYRFRGFGQSLIANGNQKGVAPVSSIGNLATADYQEWTVGLELTVPIGYRKAHAAVQHAELNLARDRAVQREMQREVVSNLSGAFADIDRAYQGMQNTLNQYLAAQTYVDALLTDKFIGGRDVQSDRLLDAQQRLVLSEIWFFRSRAEYGIALKNLHYEQGSLLAYKSLRIAGGGTDPDSPEAIPDSIPTLESDPLNPELPPVPEAGADQGEGEVLPIVDAEEGAHIVVTAMEETPSDQSVQHAAAVPEFDFDRFEPVEPTTMQLPVVTPGPEIGIGSFSPIPD